MASKVQLDLDYTKLTIGKHEDVSLPQVYETASEHLVKLQDMDIREDDVLLCSYPKSGDLKNTRMNGWLTQISVIETDKGTVACYCWCEIGF